MLTLTKVYDKNFAALMSGDYRYIANQGGTSSSKTFSILQLLTSLALYHKLHIDIVGLSVPHLKTGVLNDMPHIFEQYGLNWYEMYNHSDKYVQFPDAGRLQFIAFDNIGKAHGGRRDILYLNEANHLAYPIVEQLAIRTKKVIFIDYNPTNPFWFHKKIQVEKPKECILIKSTYKDNQYLEPSIVAELESKKGDGNNNFWRVYGLGELGIAEGLVFENVIVREITDEEISHFDNIKQGIDWGYAADPFVFLKLHYSDKYKKIYIFDEICQHGLLNSKAIELVNEKREPYANLIADSEDPKSIAEFWDAGLDIRGAKKGPGSRGYGFKFLQGMTEIIIDPIRCPNAAREFLNAEFEKDKNGDRVNEYPEKNDHTIDAARYALEYDMPYAMRV